ncbi:hypothetical protein NLI96_g420 [Meripilus lineatus]|uniref:Coatomer subunit epsilon n=1 Tax=Meripilus lineatus TaxID=2056292 RepID=A0AAD5YNX9_9APHY|nr:hypothetical protein NLI96_g420 [Physisporinus lineatus]
MDSSELYHVRQQFTLGAYKSLVDLTLPDPNSADYTPTLVYQARAHIALDNPSAVITLIPSYTENVALKAVLGLAKYVVATEESDQESALEELRDLSLEIEGDDIEAEEREKGFVRVLAGTAFARAGEIEEALETLGGTGTRENLEAVALIVQIYLSINRPDLARKELEKAKHWAEDDVLLQLIESSINLVTGKDSYSDSTNFYTEQLGNPSLTSPRLLTARGITRLLRGEIAAAKSDFEEAVEQQDNVADAETLAGMTVAAGLGTSKNADTEAEALFSQLTQRFPTHPLVTDTQQKASLFDELATKFEVPPLASAAA